MDEVMQVRERSCMSSHLPRTSGEILHQRRPVHAFVHDVGPVHVEDRGSWNTVLAHVGRKVRHPGGRLPAATSTEYATLVEGIHVGITPFSQELHHNLGVVPRRRPRRTWRVVSQHADRWQSGSGPSATTRAPPPRARSAVARCDDPKIVLDEPNTRPFVASIVRAVSDLDRASSHPPRRARTLMTASIPHEPPSRSRAGSGTHRSTLPDGVLEIGCGTGNLALRDRPRTGRRDRTPRLAHPRRATCYRAGR